MESLEELKILNLEQLNEKVDHAKRMHYQFLSELNLSNVSKDQQREALAMSDQVKMIDYVFGQKLCDAHLLKTKSWAF